jgi:hypothetical protein
MGASSLYLFLHGIESSEFQEGLRVPFYGAVISKGDITFLSRIGRPLSYLLLGSNLAMQIALLLSE